MAKNKIQKHVPNKTKLKKDPGVPKLPDLKQRKSIQQQKAIKKVAFPGHEDADAVMAAEPTLSSLALLAADAQAQEASSSSGDPSSSSGVNNSLQAQQRRYYIRTLHKVIDEADIIILVLDARDPEGCRSRLVEEEVRRREHEGKKLVFVLNKVDLIPRANAEAWLRYLRHTAPTLPFKSSTQQQRTNLTSHTSPALLNLLKAYKRPIGAKTSITVGIVGYPNVGKSSLINSLKRAKVCAVAAEAGFTKEMQSVQVERGVRVLDSPGVVFGDETSESTAGSILLRNVVKVEDIPDPIAVVEQILSKTEHSKLQQIYSLPQFNSTLEFLTMLALSAGRLHKGGTPDVLAASRQVIQDWNAQKIPYFSTPPTVHSSSVPEQLSESTITKYGIEGNVAPGAENIGSAAIVTEFAPAFDLGGLFSQADSGAFNNDANADCDMEQDGLDDQVVEMESDDLTPRIPRKRSRSPSPIPSATSPPTTAATPSTVANGLSEPPPSKRARRTKSLLVDGSSASGLAANNPLNRRALKQNAKRARKAERKQLRRARGGGGSMEIDDGAEGAGLAFTFMANVDGVIAA